MNTAGMTIGFMLGQSTILMVMGITTVFLFLIIMIFALGAVHKLVHGLKLDAPTATAAPATAPAPVQTAAPAAGGDGAIVAAIAAALHVKG